MLNLNMMNNSTRFFIATLSVTVAIFIASGCKKEKHPPFNPPPPPPTTTVVSSPGPKDYTNKMEGTRVFVGTDTTGFFPITGKNDTQSYIINVLNDSTIAIASDTLSLAIWSVTDKYIFFSQGIFPDTTAVTYYYSADSMTYYYYSRPTSCCFTKKVLHTIR